jgi:acetyl esterase/lipase
MTPLKDLLDPEIATLMGDIAFDMDAETLPMMRDMSYATPAIPEVERTDTTVPGDPALPIRVHRPSGIDGPRACIFSIHGGGYVMGSYEMEDTFFNTLCPALGIVGLSIEYRLAPETPYPGPLEDCYRGLAWAFDNAQELGIDPGRVGIHGVSAGGGLTAALALLVRDRGEMQLAFQVLDSPMLDDRQITPSSRRDDLPVWTRTSNRFGWESYLGDLYGRDDLPYTASPARATDLSGLPPTLVTVGAVDGFRDESVEYAMRLADADVPTELHVYPGACHGYQVAADALVVKQAARDRDQWLARAIRSR